LLTHAPIVRQVLQAGVHCYSEKPLTLSRREADELAELAERNRVLLLCAPVLPLYPSAQFLRDLLRQGAIGKVTFARARSSHGGPDRGTFATDTGNYLRAETAGSWAPLYDMGVYALTLLTFVLGSVRRVFAFADIAIAERRIEKVTEPGFVPYTLRVTTRDNGVVLLDFGDGCFACVDASYCLPYRRSPTYEFFGSHGALATDLWQDEFWLISEVADFQHPEGWHQVTVPAERRWAQRPKWERLIADHLRHCLATGERSPIHVRCVRHVVEVMEKALLAVETGRVQEVESRLDS
jgi:predicted dehydrogenase